MTQSACAVALFFAAAAFAADNAFLPPGPTTTVTPSNCIIGVLEADGHYTTLLSALDASGLSGRMHGDEIFTLFAPTNDAFQNMPGFADLQREPAAMTAFLKNHLVANRRFPTADFPKLGTLPALGGESLRFSSTDGKWMINDAIVVDPDMNASNGIVHGIDAVLVNHKASKVGETTIPAEQSEYVTDD
jgi:uncharacterized surface protein with fasciclin (FAS1) repeats